MLFKLLKFIKYTFSHTIGVENNNLMGIPFDYTAFLILLPEFDFQILNDGNLTYG